MSLPERSDMREERRIVTALFADIVGSTTIAELLDPEDARDVLGGAVALVVEQVDALGGTVKDLAGDGVLALFGAPVAHEDDAERAVLCGLRIADAIARYATEVGDRWHVEGFSIRVGIETGPAVLGPVGGGSRVEYGAVGDALNTAARLESRAEPGTVLVGESTRRMIGDRFAWGAVGSFDLKGKEQPVEAACALSHTPQARAVAGAFESPLVGRAEETAGIAAAMNDLRSGRGSVVVLTGEPGVGKSRLVAEWRERFAAGGGIWLEGAAASYASSIPYVPYRHLLLAWLGLPLDASGDAVRNAIEAATPGADRTTGPLRRLQATIAGIAEDSPSGPEATRQRVFSAFRAFVLALATQRPVALALEDLHWSDGPSLELTEDLAVLVADRPVLMLLTMRPEPACLAAAARLAEAVPDRLISIDLRPLEPEDHRGLLRALVAGALPRALEDRLLEATDGNPFFLQEQLRALIDAGALVREDGAWRFAGDASLVLHPTVERALLARMDHLAPAPRDTLLAASVLGSRFDASLVAALIDGDVPAAIDELERGQFLVRAEDPGTYRFRHALVQETAYRSLLRRRRRELHARAASALETAYAGREDEIAATLGRHLAEAGEVDRAVGYLRTAARSAAAAFANEEAATLCRDALALLGRPEDLEEPQRGLARDLLATLGTALRFRARHDEAVDALRLALELTTPEDTLSRARTLTMIGEIHDDAHRYDQALETFEVAEALVADRHEEPEPFAAWLDVQLGRCGVYYWRGDVERYTQLLRRVEPYVERHATAQQRIDFYDSVRAALWRRDRYVISDELLRLDLIVYEAERESENPEDRAWAPFMHGFTLLWHRDLDEAEGLLRESLAEAEHLEDTLLRSRALTYLMVAARLRGDVAAAGDLVESVVEAAREARLPEYEATAAATSAWVAWRRGDLDSAASEGRRAMQTWERLPNRYFFDWMACLPLAAAALANRDVAGALAWIGPMLAESQQPLPSELAEQLRELTQGGPQEASARLAEALELARELGFL